MAPALEASDTSPVCPQASFARTQDRQTAACHPPHPRRLATAPTCPHPPLRISVSSASYQRFKTGWRSAGHPETRGQCPQPQSAFPVRPSFSADFDIRFIRMFGHTGRPKAPTARIHPSLQAHLPANPPDTRPCPTDRRTNPADTQANPPVFRAFQAIPRPKPSFSRSFSAISALFRESRPSDALFAAAGPERAHGFSLLAQESSVWPPPRVSELRHTRAPSDRVETWRGLLALRGCAFQPLLDRLKNPTTPACNPLHPSACRLRSGAGFNPGCSCRLRLAPQQYGFYCRADYSFSACCMASWPQRMSG